MGNSKNVRSSGDVPAMLEFKYVPLENVSSCALGQQYDVCGG